MPKKGQPIPQIQRFSDEEMLSALHKHGGNRERAAQELGVAVRSLYTRINRLEGRMDVPLFSSRDFARVSKHKHNAIASMNVSDGVVLVGTDAHIWPNNFTTAQRAFLHFIKNYDPRPKAIILNGDVFDGNRASRFPKMGWHEVAPTIAEELTACQETLAKFEDAAPPGSRLFWPLGNHDLRFEARLCAALPEWEGVPNTTLKEFFPRWIPCWSLWLNEKTEGWTEVKHRMKGGIHAPFNNVAQTAIHTVTGHLHSMKVMPRENRWGTRYGVDAGTLADVHGEQFVHYTEASQLDWRSGFVVLTFWKGRLLYPELCKVLDEDAGLVEFRGNVLEV